MSDVYDFEVHRLNGDLAKLGEYRGKVLLIVNTASQCGFTPQYSGLEALYLGHDRPGEQADGPLRLVVGHARAAEHADGVAVAGPRRDVRDLRMALLGRAPHLEVQWRSSYSERRVVMRWTASTVSARWPNAVSRR